MENNFINETNNIPESMIEQEETSFFCRKCGNKLLPDMNVCNKCGTSFLKQDDVDILEEDIPFNSEEFEASKLLLKKRKRKIFLKILISILSVAVLSLIGFFVSKLIVKPQDINTINGCPEFYELKFGMTADEASRNIKLKHKAVNGIGENPLFEANDFMKNSSVIIDREEVFYLYGKKAEYVYIGFDQKYLNSVLFTFSKDRYSLSDIVKLYKRIYGEATETNTISSTWADAKTTIDIFEHTFEDGESNIVVRYLITPNSQYKNLSFDGSELDPCGFLDENYVFNKKPVYYINGLREGVDYSKEVYPPEGLPEFSKYTLYPRFEYMGIEKGHTAIEFDVGKGKDRIEIASYKFLLSEENAVDRMTYIHSKLSEMYGKEYSSTYTSTYYDKIGVKNVSFSEMKNRIGKDTEGIYHIQWKFKGRNITLNLTISADKKYYEGSVSFTK